jgi:filamentous hemagglutinin family protein
MKPIHNHSYHRVLHPLLTALVPWVWWVWVPTSGLAQIVPAHDGTGTIVTPVGNQFNIDGGQHSTDGSNLFHSFAQFGLNEGQIANFISNPQIDNIFGQVVGGDPSYINGLLQVSGGNSNLFLINPAGIIFGSNASLNVPADFTATTATGIGFDSGTGLTILGNNSWGNLVGTPHTLEFNLAHPGVIVNEGNLAVVAGQNLSLIGGVVANTGTLQASGGNVTLTTVPGEGLVRLSASGNVLSLDINPGVGGTNLNPRSLPEILTGGQGISHASRLVANSDGTVSLLGSGESIDPRTGTLLVSGSVDVSTPSSASDTPNIWVLGDRIALLDATLNASGWQGGGNILIGGDLQGGGSLPHASQVFVNPNSSLFADALHSGNGGQVIVWADYTTQFYGNVSATGGITPGFNSQNGGFVEISGKETLVFRGRVDVSATQGNMGTILFDPDRITIDNPNPPGNNNPNPPGNNNPNPPVNNNPNPPVNNNPNPPGNNNPNPPGNNNPNPPGNNNPNPPGNNNPNPPVNNNPNPPGNNNPNPPINPNGDNPNPPVRDIFADRPKDEPTVRPEDLGNTNGNIILSANNDFVINEPIVQTGSVEVRAGRSININANIDTSRGNGNIWLRANHPEAAAGLRQPGLANIYQAPGTILNAGRGNILLEIGTVGEVGDIQLANINTAGAIEVNANGGNILHNARNARISANSALFQTTGNIGTPTEPIQLDVTQVQPLADGTRVFYDNLRLNDAATQSVPPDISTRPEVEVDSPRGAENPQDVSIDTGDGLELDGGGELKDSSGELEPSEDSELGEENQTKLPDDVGDFTPVSGRPMAPEAAISSIEDSRNTEFTKLFGSDLDLSATTTTSAREALADITEQTGNRSGVIYVTLLPDEIELVLFTASGEPIRRSVPNISPEQVSETVNELRRSLTSPRLRNSDQYLTSAQQLYQWLIAPLKTDLEAANIETLLFSMGTGLRSIPLAALHDGQQFLVENYSLSLIPSMSLVDTRYRSLQNTQALGMGASEFTNLNPLPAVPLELTTITQNLWQGKAFLNHDFTRENLITQRQKFPYPIIHLATHGEFQAGDPSQSYIQLWDEQLSLDRLRELGWNNPPVELLVLSACRTAVGDANAELGFAGLAIAAGVKSALASLWYVSDEGTLALMTEFYSHLSHTKIKAEALRQAQIAMLRNQVRLESGRLFGVGLPEEGILLPSELSHLNQSNLSHPYYWSAFTMIGSPW